MPTYSRRQLLRSALQAGVAVAGIAAVGCASPEVYNTGDQRTSDKASAPVPQEPEPQQEQPSATPAPARPAATPARPAPQAAGGEIIICTRPSNLYSNDLSFGTETVPRVVVDPREWRERYHWRTLPIRHDAAPGDADITFNSDHKLLSLPDAVDSATWLPLLYSQLVVLAAGDGIDAHRAAVEGDLAERWETPDAATIVFTLREGINWPGPDGGAAAPLTAADVAAAHETHRAPKTGSRPYTAP